MRSEVGLLPTLFLDRLRRLIPLRKWDGVANTFTQPKPATFRVNSLKNSRQAVRQKLEQEGFRLAPVSWYPEGFILREGRQRELEKTEVYKKGAIYVQGLSSMVPALVLDPKPGETILDLAAAPGSKTTQIACLMKGQGTIVALESNQIRYLKLKSNVERQGVQNAELILGYGETFGKKHAECFDRVLVDAPCSAEGLFDVREPASYRYWNLKRIHQSAKLQKKLLISGLLALKPGGVLVYSTCTFAPEENELVLSETFKIFGGALELEPIRLPLSNVTAGLAKWEGVNSSARGRIRNVIRILPTLEMEGFFIARLRKKAAFEPQSAGQSF